MNKHIIELNGKLYDAATGALLRHAQTPAKQQAATVASAPKLQVAIKARTDRSHHAAQPKPHGTRQPQATQTLMRRAVHKPEQKALPVIKQQTPITVNSTTTVISPKRSAVSIDEVRLKRAQTTPRSTTVQRFSEVQPPVPRPNATTPRPAQPVSKSAQSVPVRRAHMDVVAPPSSALRTSPAAKQPTAIFEQALESAKSHEEQAPSKKALRRAAKEGVSHHHRRRIVVNSLAAVFAVFVIGGFVAYMNKAAIQLEIASVQAGVQASIPSYTPTGYTASAPSADDDAVKISFVSDSGSAKLTLSQSASNWNSDDLFDDIVSRYNTTDQTVQSGGYTIYFYGTNQAAWVSDGVLYEVASSANLVSSQLISLANSL